ncbi:MULTISPECIES: hypothetical protein [unclassified Allomuricauda]|uniref:hypothetical protein n=1 Tax=unclassified Allomuricauda TaxID=2615049 RepID=UPI00273DE797|nr:MULTISPECIES: hypothetical protein [unclassified Allomuricauda]
MRNLSGVGSPKSEVSWQLAVGSWQLAVVAERRSLSVVEMSRSDNKKSEGNGS